MKFLLPILVAAASTLAAGAVAMTPPPTSDIDVRVEVGDAVLDWTNVRTERGNAATLSAIHSAAYATGCAGHRPVKEMVDTGYELALKDDGGPVRVDFRYSGEVARKTQSHGRCLVEQPVVRDWSVSRTLDLPPGRTVVLTVPGEENRAVRLLLTRQA